MGKIRVRTGRGTGTIEVDEDSSKWSGDEFKKIQEERKKVAGSKMVHTGRGTSSRRLGDIPEPKARRSTEGMTRSTGRGTSSRKSTNKGSQ